MRATTTAANLNLMIQAHIDSRKGGEYTWHTDVYLHPAGFTGCNWNVGVNCNEDALNCGASLSLYLDTMRAAYAIAADDATAAPFSDVPRKRHRSVRAIATRAVGR